MKKRKRFLKIKNNKKAIKIKWNLKLLYLTVHVLLTDKETETDGS